MLNAIKVVGQIAVGVAVGNVAANAMEKLVVEPIKKVIEAKKGSQQ
jgi:hypothetical protein